MTRFCLLTLLLTPFILKAQNQTKKDSNWNIKMVASLNGSKSAVSNWAAGGQTGREPRRERE
mgnify:CR=1 FL=1